MTARATADVASADDTAREAVRRGLDRCLQVTAGAGTGKTHELVGRIAGLVARGEPVTGMAVITFPEKAAAELRDRVRARLEAMAEHGAVPGATGNANPGPSGDPEGEPDPSGETGPDTVRARARDALGALDEATICTVHAFAHRILAEAPYATGVTPGFEVLDEVTERVEHDAWWRHTLVRMHDDPDLERPLVALAAACGVRARELRALADTLDDRREHLEGHASGHLPTVPPVETGPLAVVLRPVTDRLGECGDPADRLAAHLDRLRRWLDELDDADDEVTRLRLLATQPLTGSKNLGRQEHWPQGAKREILAGLENAERIRTDLLGRVLLPALQAVTAWLSRAVLDAAAARTAAGRLTYHDLLVLAASALRRDPDLRERLSSRWRRILIDEFQDTDPLQLEIAVRLAAVDPRRADGPWPDVALRPGALFVVGDPQQSIYRFRRADIGLYREALHRLDADRVHLARNRRSRPGILTWVNTVFGALLDDDPDGLQVAHRPLEAHLPAEPAVPIPVHRLGGPVTGPAGSKPTAAQVREREAAALVAAAQRIVAEGWTVRTTAEDPKARPDGTGGFVRPARFSDLAVLMPTRLMLRPLEAAFERAGLPLRVECQSLLWATPEVTDLARILRAVADPGDHLALVAALRTPALGCSDRALAEYRLAGGRWSIHAPPPAALDPDHPVPVALRRLRDLAEQVRFLTVDAAVEAVIRELRLLQLATFSSRPRDGWRRLRHVAATARSFAPTAGVTLRDFVDWVDAQADAAARVEEAVVAEPDDDAVRVFTVHGAKGLEFPIVLLTGLGAQARRSTRRAVVTAGGVEVSLGRADGHRIRTPGFEAADAAEQAAETAEELRLWYVAATRARDHLVVGCHHPDPANAQTPSFAARLWRLDEERHLPWAATFAGDTDPTDDPADAGPSTPPPPATAGPLEPQPGAADRDRWWASRAARLAPVTRRPVLSATALGRRVPRPASDPASEPADPGEAGPGPDDPDRPAWRRGRAGTARGRAVHAVLQTIDLIRGDGLDAAARAQAEAEAIPAEAARIARLARSARQAPTVQAAASGTHWREVPVTATVDGVLVEGYVDLLAVAGDGSLVVIDFKTDAFAGAQPPAERLGPYRKQLAAYALALEAVTGRRVSDAVLVFARDGRPALEHRIDDLPAARAEVRAELAAYRGGGVGPAGLEPTTHGL